MRSYIKEFEALERLKTSTLKGITVYSGAILSDHGFIFQRGSSFMKFCHFTEPRKADLAYILLGTLER